MGFYDYYINKVEEMEDRYDGVLPGDVNEAIAESYYDVADADSSLWEDLA